MHIDGNNIFFRFVRVIVGVSFLKYYAKFRKGVKCHNITEKTGKLCAITSVEENDDLIMITNDGTIIRIPISGIPVYSRSAGGVIVMRLSEGSSIVNIARIAYEEPKEDQPAEAEAVAVGEEALQPESAEKVKEPIEEGKENEEA